MELFVSSKSDIVFNPSAGAITDHSQSANDIYPYFKPQLYVENSATESRYSILPNGLSKRRDDSNPQPLGRRAGVLSLRSHRSLNKIYH